MKHFESKTLKQAQNLLIYGVKKIVVHNPDDNKHFKLSKKTLQPKTFFLYLNQNDYE